MTDTGIDTLQALFIAWGLRIGGACLILLIGHWLSKALSAIAVRVVERRKVDITLSKFLHNIIYYLVITAFGIAAIGHLGIKTTSFVAVLGTAGLAVGLALKDSLGNFASGVMLILLRQFRVGDWVTIAGQSGSVEEITIFNTVINTGDNQRIIIPNGKISNDTIINANANPTRRIDLVISISYDDDIRKAKSILQTIIAQEPLLLESPAARIAVSELADSSVNFVVRPWVKTGDYWEVRFSLTEKIKQTFDDEGISIPFPQRDVHIHTSEHRSGSPVTGDAKGLG
jgi:small conductance mechanosensitive channel